MGELLQALIHNPDQAFVTLALWGQQVLTDYPTLALLLSLLLSTAPLLVIFPSCFAITTWLERKGLARIQNRLGPNRTGWFGLLQPAADGVKMLSKEDIVPRAADQAVHLLAPILVMVPALGVWAFVPLGRNMTSAVVENAVILFFALGSVSTLAVFMAGWSSRNKYALLGGLRAIAQMISYEIPLVLSAVTVVMLVGSLSTTAIVEAQQGLFGVGGWNVWTPWGFLGFLIFFVASLAELNRSPFDLPEADSELIAGHLTEYSGFKYALFFMAEYISAFAISGLAVTLFLGGWQGPVLPSFVWFFVKMFGLVVVMIWVRGTFPRLRVDQLMSFAWKFLVPLALWNVAVVGLVHFLSPTTGWVVGGGLLLVAYFGLIRLHRGAHPVEKRTYRFAS